MPFIAIALIVAAALGGGTSLAANGRLDAEAQTGLESNFSAHAGSVQKQITRLQEKGDYAAAADVAARFQATVATHATALANAKARASTNANANAQAVLGNLINKVQTTLDTASSL